MHSVNCLHGLNQRRRSTGQCAAATVKRTIASRRVEKDSSENISRTRVRPASPAIHCLDHSFVLRIGSQTVAASRSPIHCADSLGWCRRVAIPILAAAARSCSKRRMAVAKASGSGAQRKPVSPCTMDSVGPPLARFTAFTTR